MCDDHSIFWYIPYTWSDNLKVSYDNLDEQHKELMEVMDAWSEDVGNQTALDKLRTKIKAHFDTEEAMMIKANYEKYEEHKKIHDSFLEDLSKITVPCDKDTIMITKWWLVDHIKEHDEEYVGKLG